jgi:HSP20 family protein
MVYMLQPTYAWDVFDSLLGALDRDVSSRLGSRGGHALTQPRIQTEINDDGAQVTVSLPGIHEKNLELDLEANVLSISAKRDLAVPEGAKALRRERTGSQFKRRVSFPFQVDAERGAASDRDGVLTVTVYRKEADKPRRIAIHVDKTPKLSNE